MQETLICIALALIIVLLLIQVVRSECRPPKVQAWPLPPTNVFFYDVDKLSDVPASAHVAGSLVNVRVGIGSKGVFMHNGKEFVKLETTVCPTCGK